jgi:hypothetical protein
MRRARRHRLTTKFAALLAIAAVGIVQPALSACTCGMLAASPKSEEATKEKASPPCCSSCCIPVAEEVSSDCCGSGSHCGSTAGGPHKCDDCSCCTSAEEYPLVPQVTSAPTDHDSLAAAYLPTSSLLQIGLNGAAWQNAFDLSSSGTPPGIRLHALLSVWRN